MGYDYCRADIINVGRPFAIMNPQNPGTFSRRPVRPRLIRRADHNDRVRFEKAAAWFPLALYALALAAQTLMNSRKGIGRALAAFPLLFATHVFYGLGFWRGLFTRVDRTQPATTEVTFDRPAL